MTASLTRPMTVNATFRIYFKLVVAGIFAGLALLIAISSPATSLWIVGAGGSALTAALAPELAIALFLFALPVFGNKPGTTQAHCLLMIGLSLQAGLLCRSKQFYSRTSPKKNLPAILLLYGIVSALSLLPFSFYDLAGWLRSSMRSVWILHDIQHALTAILLSREDEYGYSALSVLWTILSILLAGELLHYAKDSRSRVRFSFAIASGLFVSLIVGILDYYSVINLHWLRGLDPVVNPQDTQFRLQSWFGHSGWFAEYVTLVAPWAMLLLLLRCSFRLRVAAVLIALLLGEFVLILTFQRGGWLSYPLTLLCIWAAVYVVRQLEQGRSDVSKALRASVLKIAVSVPLTLLISMGALWLMGSQFGIDQYAERFKDISKASDRSSFAVAGAKLGALSPILGLGSESFALRYEREFEAIDGTYRGQIILPLHGSAHNLYAQTFSGKGIAGLICLLGIIVSLANGLLTLATSPAGARSPAISDRVIALSCFCSLCAAFIYGCVQELFYVQSLQYAFFAICGLSASLLPTKTWPWQRYLGISLLCLFAHLSWLAFFYPTLSSHPIDGFKGCYDLEIDANGNGWRWCGLRSSIVLPSSRLSVFQLSLAPSAESSRGEQLVSIKACGSELSLTLKGGEKKALPIPPGCQGQENIEFHLTSGNVFNPSRTGTSSDPRVLSFKISAPAQSW